VSKGESDVLADLAARLASMIAIVESHAVRLVDEAMSAHARSVVQAASELRDIARSRADDLALQASEAASESDERPQTPEATRGLVAVYDQTRVTERGAENIKWYNPNAPLGTRTGRSRRTLKRGICFHHTAIRGGFGTRRARVDAWMKAGGDVSPRVPVPGGGSQPGEWLTLPIQDVGVRARALAVADRYRGFVSDSGNRGVPYHAVYHPGLRLLVRNLPTDWVTWHGDGSNNDFAGWAWDAHSGSEEPPAELEDAIGNTIEEDRRLGHYASGVEFTVHAAWTNKPRDPGRAFVQRLIELAPMFGATIRMDFKATPRALSIREILA